jgi:hypothetical protein
MDWRAALTQHRRVARVRISVEELLMRHRAINEDQLARAVEKQKRLGGDVGRILVDLGYVSEELLLRAQAHQLGIPLVDPVKNPPPIELTQCMPVLIAERFLVIPVGGNAENRLLRIATSSPGDAQAAGEIARLTGYRIELAAATSKSIEQAIRVAYYGESESDIGGSGSAGEGRSASARSIGDDTPPEIEPEPEHQNELQDLRGRLAKAERQLSNQQYAAALARIERLEQIAENDHHALNVLGQVLLDIGAITREELKRRLTRT